MKLNFCFDLRIRKYEDTYLPAFYYAQQVCSSSNFIVLQFIFNLQQLFGKRAQQIENFIARKKPTIDLRVVRCPLGVFSAF